LEVQTLEAVTTITVFAHKGGRPMTPGDCVVSGAAMLVFAAICALKLVRIRRGTPYRPLIGGVVVGMSLWAVALLGTGWQFRPIADNAEIFTLLGTLALPVAGACALIQNRITLNRHGRRHEASIPESRHRSSRLKPRQRPTQTGGTRVKRGQLVVYSVRLGGLVSMFVAFLVLKGLVNHADQEQRMFAYAILCAICILVGRLTMLLSRRIETWVGPTTLEEEDKGAGKGIVPRSFEKEEDKHDVS
jgi:hypothetical protein